MVSIPIGIWHTYYFQSIKHLTEDQLVEISPEFKGINANFAGFSVVAISLLIGFPLIAIAPSLDKWAMQNYGIGFYPTYIMFGSGYGIYQGLFALMTGAYPMGRLMGYVYDKRNKINYIARIQIVISVAFVIIGILFFFATV